MLHFISSLFRTEPPDPKGPDEALLKAAIERVVDGTDRRLRSIGNYRKRLIKPVEAAVVHVLALVDSLPEATEISRRAYSNDPRLRAFFVSADDLQTKVGGSKSVGDFLKTRGGAPPEEIFGVLTMEWEQRNVLGMQLQGDVVQRDVPQVVVNFYNHRYFGPAASEAENRWQGKVRIFDYLIERALERIVATRGKRTELEYQRGLLQRKLAAMKCGDWGLGPMLAEAEHEQRDPATLEAEIDAIEKELLELGARPDELEHTLQHIIDTLGRPSDWLDLRKTTVTLNRMSVKTADPQAAGASRLELNELFASTGGETRILLPGRFPRQDLPERPDFLTEAQRYLG
ncbi:MAG: hypothetical protein PVF07_05730 [Thiogranum sp.]|jgi:hypothetical protein